MLSGIWMLAADVGIFVTLLVLVVLVGFKAVVPGGQVLVYLFLKTFGLRMLFFFFVFFLSLLLPPLLPSHPVLRRLTLSQQCKQPSKERFYNNHFVIHLSFFITILCLQTSDPLKQPLNHSTNH